MTSRENAVNHGRWPASQYRARCTSARERPSPWEKGESELRPVETAPCRAWYAVRCMSEQDSSDKPPRAPSEQTLLGVAPPPMEPSAQSPAAQPGVRALGHVSYRCRATARTAPWPCRVDRLHRLVRRGSLQPRPASRHRLSNSNVRGASWVLTRRCGCCSLQACSP